MPVRSRLVPLPEQIGWLNTINFFESKRSLEDEPPIHLHYDGPQRRDEVQSQLSPSNQTLIADGGWLALQTLLRKSLRT
jgi:hypothetical protein